jgi:hypothetical protein
MKEKIITQLRHIWDELTYGIRWLCLCPSPGKRMVTVLILIVIFGGLNIYFIVNSIYSIGKRDAEKQFMEIRYIETLELQHKADSIKSIKNEELKIKNEEYEYK